MDALCFDVWRPEHGIVIPTRATWSYPFLTVPRRRDGRPVRPWDLEVHERKCARAEITLAHGIAFGAALADDEVDQTAGNEDLLDDL